MVHNEGVERSLKIPVSIPKKQLVTSKTSPGPTRKAKSQRLFVPHKKAVLFRAQIKLPDALREDINKKWDDCWPVSTLRPLALIDLLCYLLFLKKLEEKRLITGSPTRISGDSSTANELSWSGFKDLNAHDLHTFFTGKNGVMELIKNYGLTNLKYSEFLKEPLLLTPSVSLLFNVVNIIKLMDSHRKNISVAIFEYLLYKAEIEAQNGQVYAPDKIVKLVVELMQPSNQDSIWDPSAGNGSLLINSAKYIASGKPSPGNNFAGCYFRDNYNGIECDPIQLRIAAMNMIMNGIEDPKLGGIGSFNNSHINVCEQSTLVLSNLYFKGAYDRKTIAGKTMLVESGRSEIHFLNLILNKLKIGGRAAVIVPEFILSNFTAEMIAMRQRIIEDHKLAAVISLTNTTSSLFSGACILIFCDISAAANDTIWFCKMKSGLKKKDAYSTNMVELGAQEYKDESEEMVDMIKRWKNLTAEKMRTRTDYSFCVPVDEIRNCNYTLCFNQYRKVEKETQSFFPVGIPTINREITGNISATDEGRLKTARIKIPKQLIPALKKATLQYTGQVMLGSKRLSVKLRNLPIVFIKSNPLNILKRFHPGNIGFPPYLTPLLLIVIISTFFYFEVFRDNNYLPQVATAKTNITLRGKESQPVVAKVVANTGTKPMLTQEQIKAIIYDSTTTVQFDSQPVELSQQDSKDELAANEIADTVTVNSRAEKPDERTTNNALSVKYTVRDTTFFHNQPDESSTRKSYLDPLNNNVLDPIQEKNGFIYIVYTNRFGRTSKGWINKKDLIQLR